MENIRHAVTDSRCRSQRKVHDTKGDPQTFGGFLGHQLSYSGHFKSSFLNSFAEHFKILSPYSFQSSLYNSRAGNAYVNNCVCFCHAMEGSRHKRIVIRSVAENYQLGTAQRILVSCSFGCFQDNISHKTHCIHINAGFGRPQIYRAAYPFCAGQGFRDRTDQQFIRLSHSLCHCGAVTADEVYPYLFCRLVQSLSQSHKIFRRLAGCSSDESNRSNRNPLIYYRNSEFSGDLISRFHQMSCESGDLLIYLPVYLLQIRINTVQKTDPQSNGTHIQIFLFDHFIGLIDLIHIYHKLSYLSFLPAVFRYGASL